MPNQFRYRRHARIPPNDNLILTVTVGADNFIVVPAPCKVANLTSGIDAALWLLGLCVPEFDATIGRTAA